MHIESVKMVSFSPTGTTQAVVQAIAKGLDYAALESIDLTSPATRAQPLTASDKDLLILGMPVYMGRIPALLEQWMVSLSAHRSPVVCVVVYGNRAYENALIELTDIATTSGGVPIAGAAFIGEHSFSSPERPTAHGRPDAHDLSAAEQFGQRIRQKLDAASVYADLTSPDVPGSRPYEGITTLWDVDFIEVAETCVQCGVCAEVCPMGAVDRQDSAKIDTVKCITCCACLKSCPQAARTMKRGPVMDASLRLNSLYQERKEPEWYL